MRHSPLFRDCHFIVNIRRFPLLLAILLALWGVATVYAEGLRPGSLNSLASIAGDNGGPTLVNGDKFGVSTAQIGLLNQDPLPVPAVGGHHDSARMLQFKAGGHVLGFLPDRAYLAGLDHALRVEFAGTPGVKPQAAETETFSRVTYPNLWPGIDLVVVKLAKDSTYLPLILQE